MNPAYSSGLAKEHQPMRPSREKEVLAVRGRLQPTLNIAIQKFGFSCPF